MKKNNLKKFRKEKGKLTQKELAEKADCTPALIIAIERLGHYPRASSRTKIAAALGVSESTIWPTLEATDG
jgi:transcriptional regulator with XRE-family HTH domain